MIRTNLTVIGYTAEELSNYLYDLYLLIDAEKSYGNMLNDHPNAQEIVDALNEVCNAATVAAEGAR